ncbi:MAG: EamA family transporter [Bacteroidia bacterium]|nr:EamA family transporter [Bacteroidia bacterium]
MSNRINLLVILAFLTIYVVWGATYLFVAFAIEQIPAFQLSFIRYTSAALVTFMLIPFFKKQSLPSLQQLKNAAIAGWIFLGLGTGGVAWSLNYVDTGMAALIISAEPLLIVLMLWLVNRKRPPSQTFIGILLAMAGMFLLINQSVLISGRMQWIGISVILFSMIAWGIGSIYVSRADLPKSQLLNSGIQMIVGGLFTLMISILIGEQGISPIDYKPITWIGIAFLVLFGSVAAFTAFNYLLKRVSPEKVATSTYVNPVIALILGHIFRNEIITTQSIIAAVVMLFGVFIINSTKE